MFTLCIEMADSSSIVHLDTVGGGAATHVWNTGVLHVKVVVTRVHEEWSGS
jgi:hypothetical protein